MYSILINTNRTVGIVGICSSQSTMCNKAGPVLLHIVDCDLLTQSLGAEFQISLFKTSYLKVLFKNK